MDEYRKCINCVKFFSHRKKMKKNNFRHISCIARCDQAPQIKNLREKFLEKESTDDRNKESS